MLTGIGAMVFRNWNCYCDKGNEKKFKTYPPKVLQRIEDEIGSVKLIFNTIIYNRIYTKPQVFNNGQS